MVQPLSKRHKQEVENDVNVLHTINASSLIDLVLNSLASQAQDLSHPSSSPKKQALTICLEAVDSLRSQLLNEGHIEFLPTWIKDSEFVKQYEEDFPGEELLKLDNTERLFELPTELCVDSVVKVMDNIRYFGISDERGTITQLFEFFIKSPNHNQVESQKNAFSELRELWENVDFAIKTTDRNKFVVNAVSKNLLICLRYAHANDYPFWNKEVCRRAAKGGFLDCLKYAHENGCPWDEETCSIAACGGHLDCLKYAHENGCPWDEGICSFAASGNHLNCLKYAHENGCPWDEDVPFNAAGTGELGCLKYAHENGCPWDAKVCFAAAGGGYIECLKYAHENGCPWDVGTCLCAAKGGHLECLKYAHENGCLWDERTCLFAAKGGHLECLKYALMRMNVHGM